MVDGVCFQNAFFFLEVNFSGMPQPVDDASIRWCVSDFRESLRKSDCLRCFALCFSCVHAPKLLPWVSLGARARRRTKSAFFLVCFLRAKNHDLPGSRTGPYLKENFRKINDFIVFLSNQEVNSTITPPLV